MRSVIGFLSILVLFIATAQVPAQAQKRKKFTDECAEISKRLAKAEGSVNRLIFGRAVLGGLVGAGVGLLLSDGKAKGAVAGALVGAGIGGGTAYLEAKKREHADRKALAGSIYEDAAKSNAEAARALRAFVEVRTCRVNAATAIKAGMEKGEIDRATAAKHLAEHRKRLEKDIVEAEKFTKEFDGTIATFRDAAGALAEGNDTDQAYLKQQEGGPPPPPLPDLVRANAGATLREKASAKSTALGSIAKGESAELVANEGAWIKIRTGDGRTGYVSAKLARVVPADKPKRIDVARVTPEVRGVSQQLFEGVEKRGALDTEVALAKKNADETFVL